MLTLQEAYAKSISDISWKAECDDIRRLPTQEQLKLFTDYRPEKLTGINEGQSESGSGMNSNGSLKAVVDSHNHNEEQRLRLVEDARVEGQMDGEEDIFRYSPVHIPHMAPCDLDFAFFDGIMETYEDFSLDEEDGLDQQTPPSSLENSPKSSEYGFPLG